MCLVVLSNAQYEMLWSGLSLQVGGRLLGVFKLMLSLARTYVCMYVLEHPLLLNSIFTVCNAAFHEGQMKAH